MLRDLQSDALNSVHRGGAPSEFFAATMTDSIEHDVMVGLSHADACADMSGALTTASKKIRRWWVEPAVGAWRIGLSGAAGVGGRPLVRVCVAAGRIDMLEGLPHVNRGPQYCLTEHAQAFTSVAVEHSVLISTLSLLDCPFATPYKRTSAALCFIRPVLQFLPCEGPGLRRLLIH